ASQGHGQRIQDQTPGSGERRRRQVPVLQPGRRRAHGGGRVGGAHRALAPLFSTTSAHLSISASTRFWNASGVLGAGTELPARMRLDTSAVCTVSTITLLSLSITGLGVPAGANMPNHTDTVKPLSPSSSQVGMFGATGERSSVLMQSARSLPASMWRVISGPVPRYMVTSPAMVARLAGPLPLYGTCWNLVPASTLNSSLATCEAEPTPTEAKKCLPGSFLPRAISSFTLF